MLFLLLLFFYINVQIYVTVCKKEMSTGTEKKSLLSRESFCAHCVRYFKQTCYKFSSKYDTSFCLHQKRPFSIYCCCYYYVFFLFVFFCEDPWHFSVGYVEWVVWLLDGSVSMYIDSYVQCVYGNCQHFRNQLRFSFRCI